MTGAMYSDNGARCACRGTIYRYHVNARTLAVQTYCYTCHATLTPAFHLDGEPVDVTDVSAAHRASC